MGIHIQVKSMIKCHENFIRSCLANGTRDGFDCAKIVLSDIQNGCQCRQLPVKKVFSNGHPQQFIYITKKHVYKKEKKSYEKIMGDLEIGETPF